MTDIQNQADRCTSSFNGKPQASADIVLRPTRQSRRLRLAVKRRSPLAVLLALQGMLFLTASLANAQDRTALVIANSAYGEQKLTHIEQDATAIADALGKLGFRVTTKENLDSRAIRTAVREFADNTVTGGVAVIYIAGRGGQAGEQNYLQCADDRSFSLADFLDEYRRRHAARASLVLMDLTPQADKAIALAELSADQLGDDTIAVVAVGDAERRPSRLAASLIRQLARGEQTIGELVDAVKKDVPAKLAVHGGVDSPRRERISKTGDYLDAPLPREGERAGQLWVNGIGVVFVWCPAGSFTMGMRDTDSPLAADAQPVDVKLSEGFWIGKFECTQREFERMQGRILGLTMDFQHPQAPLSHLSDAGRVAKSLSDFERKAGRLPKDWEYALPTEAQWEYAARAGSDGRYCFGDDVAQLARYGNFADRSLGQEGSQHFYVSAADDGIGSRPTVVGSYLPNAWGLHDVHGNVSEWCADYYRPKLLGGTDPQGEREEGNRRLVLRGGAWCSPAEYCQLGFRNPKQYGVHTPNYPFAGVRIVLRKK